VQDDAEKRTIHFQPAVVDNEPRLLNLLMKKFTRERVIPTISARVF